MMMVDDNIDGDHSTI